MNSLFAQDNAKQPSAADALVPAPATDGTQTITAVARNENLPADAKQPPASNGISEFLFIMLPAILIFYWFFMLRPQQKQQDQQRKMIDGLEKNDRILTVGGVIGTIHSVDKENNEIVVKVDDSNNTKIRFALGAVQMIFPKDEK